jgi:hypothetical protein
MSKRVSERRRQRRIGWRRAGRIVSLTGEAGVDCIVLDISVRGARLMVSIPELVPDYFKLDYGSKTSIPKCRVRWRDGHEFGIEFFGRSRPAN